MNTANCIDIIPILYLLLARTGDFLLEYRHLKCQFLNDCHLTLKSNPSGFAMQ